MGEFGAGFVFASILWLITVIAGYRAPITYEMINKAEQVCYINSNTKRITADSTTVNIECRNGAKFEVDRSALREDAQ